MSDNYGLQQFRELIEKAFNDYKNPMNVPMSMDPESFAAKRYREAKREAFLYVLEMMPVENPDVARYQKLRRLMGSNVEAGWAEVCNLGAIAAYMNSDDFDGYLDNLSDEKVNVGLNS